MYFPGIEEAMRLLVRYIMTMDTWNSSILNPDEAEDSFADAYGKNGGTVTLRAEEPVTQNSRQQQQQASAGEKRAAKCSC